MAIKKSEDVQPGDLIHPPLSPVWVELEPITAEQALSALEAVVQEKGRDTYASGYYTYLNGAPCCVVGHVFEHLRIPGWREYDGVRDDKGLIALERDAESFPAMTTEAYKILHCAQTTQDLAHSWGEALDDAKEWATELEVSS